MNFPSVKYVVLYSDNEGQDSFSVEVNDIPAAAEEAAKLEGVVLSVTRERVDLKDYLDGLEKKKLALERDIARLKKNR